MDSLLLQRDEATRDRVRQALEFLDPRMSPFTACCVVALPLSNRHLQMTSIPAATKQTSS